jgi:hypothetical protein
MRDLSCIALSAAVFAACGDDKKQADPCEGVTCSDHGSCVDTDNAATCACDAGYSADGLACVDVDECADGTDDCGVGALCTNTGGTFTCACDVGHSGDGKTCVFDGVECDPTAADNDCEDACVPVDGGGVCADACDTAATCPAGWRCDPDHPTAGAVGLCLPNAACGTQTAAGTCDGDTLTYCGFDGPATVDCGELTDVSGDPLVCGQASSDGHLDCVTANYQGGCGATPIGGVCNGTVLTFCTSQAAGTIETYDCADDSLVCTVSDGVADCAPAGATGCGSVTERGTCQESTVRFCDAGEVVSTDCAADAKVCGTDASNNFRCVEPSVSSGQHNVTGTFVFEKKKLSEEGLGAVFQQPVRHAYVTVRRSSDDTKLAEGYTAQDGTFALQFEGDGEAYVLVTAQGRPGIHNHAVYDCPLDDCGGLGNLYGAATEGFTPGADFDAGTKVITVDSGNAGAFNIFDAFVKGADFAKANMGAYPPVVTVHWQSGFGTAGGTSYFSGQDAKIHILGGAEDTDEYDDPVLLHEYGHYLEFHLSRSDSPGGDHDGSKTDPRLAWGEGYGTYIGCAIADTPLYIDTTAAGTTANDVRINGNQYLALLDSPQRMNQLMSEYLITQILWTIAAGPDGVNGKTHGPTLDVLAAYFTSFTSESDGRGVDGVDFVDFLDGWFCRGHGDRPYIEAIVNDTAMFPYDYAGPATCNQE